MSSSNAIQMLLCTELSPHDNAVAVRFLPPKRRLLIIGQFNWPWVYHRLVIHTALLSFHFSLLERASLFALLLNRFHTALFRTTRQSTHIYTVSSLSRFAPVRVGTAQFMASCHITLPVPLIPVSQQLGWQRSRSHGIVRNRATIQF